MRPHTVCHTFHTERRREFIHITEDVADAVREAAVAEGTAIASAMHITAGSGSTTGTPISRTCSCSTR